jgi:hypothetical protein
MRKPAANGDGGISPSVIGSGSLAADRASSSEGELLFHLASDGGCL